MDDYAMSSEDETPTVSPIDSMPQSPLVSASSATTPGTELGDPFNALPPSSIFPNEDEYVLVVGGLGYIGSHTTYELVKEGYNVIIIDNMSNAFPAVKTALNELADDYAKTTGRRRPKIDVHDADFRDEVRVRRILSAYSPQFSWSSRSAIKGVIHFAAYKSVSESIAKPLKYYNNNVSGLIGFCELLAEFNIKNLVFSSSATVYGSLADKGGRLPEELCTHTATEWEDTKGQAQTTAAGCTGLTNPYGRTKWMCEAILADLAASDPEWTVVALRYFNPVGCDESGRLGEDPRQTPTNLMPVVLRVMTGDMEHLNVFGTDWDTEDGTAVRDFIHVSDLARGHLAALSTKMKGFQTINVGTGTGHSVKEVVTAMQMASGRIIPTVEVGRREGDVGMCVADPSKAMKEMGWKPQKTLLDSCRDLCRFLGIPTVPEIRVTE